MGEAKSPAAPSATQRDTGRPRKASVRGDHHGGRAMSRFQLRTVRGYGFGEVSSAMQKAIRRADVQLAGYWAIELWSSGFGNYVWKRLLTISAEDCWGIITHEVKALHDAYLLVNKGVPAASARGRIFVSKAVILLSLAKKNRDADHLQNFVYDQCKDIDAAK